MKKERMGKGELNIHDLLAPLGEGAKQKVRELELPDELRRSVYWSKFRGVMVPTDVISVRKEAISAFRAAGVDVSALRVGEVEALCERVLGYYGGRAEMDDSDRMFAKEYVKLLRTLDERDMVATQLVHHSDTVNDALSVIHRMMDGDPDVGSMPYGDSSYCVRMTSTTSGSGHEALLLVSYQGGS